MKKMSRLELNFNGLITALHEEDTFDDKHTNNLRVNKLL